MALNPKAVRVAGTGEVFFAPEGTAAPTTLTETLADPWIGVGLTTPDGVKFTMSRDTNDIDAWQMSKIRVVTNKEPVTTEFTLLETREGTLPYIFGGGTIATTGTGNAAVTTFTPPLEGTNAIRAMIVVFKDGASLYQYYFPRVQAEGDVSFTLARTDALSYGVTMGVLANDPKWKMFTNDPEFKAAAVVQTP